MTAKASVVVQNIPTNERLLQMLLVRYSFHIATAYSVEEVGW